MTNGEILREATRETYQNLAKTIGRFIIPIAGMMISGLLIALAIVLSRRLA
ncbi:MAG: hypothetical protein WC309_04000 [Candidatus Paceibacterota bacterium]|jgi:phosphotransferase system  glucose/maltose/N-acetylglucosamine-specific IIC component